MPGEGERLSFFQGFTQYANCKVCKFRSGVIIIFLYPYTLLIIAKSLQRNLEEFFDPIKYTYKFIFS